MKSKKNKISPNRPAQRRLSVFEKKLLAKAKFKCIVPSLLACNSLIAPKKLKVTLKHQHWKTKKEESNQYSINLKQTFKGKLTFEITNPKYFEVSGIYHEENYGLTRELILTNTSGVQRYVKADSIQEFVTTFPKGKQKLKGKFTSLGTAPFCSNKKWYFRLLVPIGDAMKNIKYPHEYIKEHKYLHFDQKKWNTQMTMMGMRFVTLKGTRAEINVEDKKYDFYTVEDVPGQFIDSHTKLDLESFKRHAHAIRSAFAILSGKYYRDQVFYVASSKKDFTKIDHVFFEQEEESVLTDNRMIDFQLVREMYDDQNEDYKAAHKSVQWTLSSAIFSNLCSEIATHQPVNRTVELIISGNRNLNSVQKGAIYSVAIETLTGEIYERNKTDLKPIKDKTLAKDLRENLIGTLKTFEKKIGAPVITMMTAKLENINQPTNREKLSMPFEYYGIKLSEEERDILEHRNKFLHGKTPKTDKYELEEVVLQLHHLIGCLILKHVGYSGYVTNLSIIHLFKYPEKIEKQLKSALTTDVKSKAAIEELIKQGKFEEAKRAAEDTVGFLKKLKEQKQKIDSFVRII